MAEELVTKGHTRKPVAATDGLAMEAMLRRTTLRIFEAYSKGVFKVYCPLSVKNAEALPPSPFLLCSNHCSHMDSTALMVAAGLPFERFGLIAAQDYFVSGGGMKSALMWLLNILPVNRRGTRKAISEHLARCRDFVGAGDRNLIMYPEGTRSTTGAMRPFKRGAGMLAVELGMPVVPAHIEGTFLRWRKGTRFIRRGPISVTFGDAVYPADFDTDEGAPGSRVDRRYGLVTEELERRVRALGGEASREEASRGGTTDGA